MTSFLRNVQVLVGPANGQGRSWSEGNRIRFRVEKTRAPEPNTAVVEIWNINPDSRRFLEGDQYKLIVKAGYGGNPFVIFTGDINQTTHQFGGGDIVTKIEAEDGGRPLRESFTSLHRGPGATPLQLLEELVESLGMSSRIVQNGDSRRRSTRPYLQGVSLHGPTRVAARRIAEAAGFEFSVQDGVVTFLPVDGETFDPAPLISVGTGLVGYPVKAKIDMSHRRRRASGGRERAGVIVTSLLNRALNPGQPYQLDSAVVSGIFVVQRVDYSGDSESGDFYAQTESVERLNR